jgi:hypothetical protein
MYPVVHVRCARAHDPPDPASAHRRGRVSAAAGALTGTSGSASRPPPAAPRARCQTRACAPTVRPRRAVSGPPPTRAGRPRSPAMRARGSADGRRPATPPPPHPTPRGSAQAPGAAAPRAAAQRRHRRDRARRRRRARDAQFLQELAPAERLGERLHLRVDDEPASHRARVPARARRATMGGRGDERAEATGKETTHALNAPPHARDRHTDAFGAAMVP